MRSLFERLLLEEEVVKSCIFDSFSLAEVVVAHFPCNISDLDISPCGVSEATVKEEELFVELDSELPAVAEVPELVLFSVF